MEMNKIMLGAQDIAYKLNHSEVSIAEVLYSIVSTTDSQGYKILSIWADETKKVKKNITMENLKVGLKEYLEGTKMPSSEQVDDVDDVGIDDDLRQVLITAQNFAAQFQVTNIGSEFFVLALASEFPSLLASANPDFVFDEKKIKEIIAGNLVGGGNVNPDGENTKNKFDDPDGSKTPALDAFSIDLTQKAKDGKLEPVIGRDVETNRILQVLNRKTKNNPVLIGHAGVGKSAIVEGLVQKMQNEETEIYKNKRVLQLNLTNVVAGTRYRGEFEERMRKLIDELVNNKDIILFIDELHTIIGAGGAEGALEASNILKPYLARGEIQLIGATTTDEYRKYIEKDAALERRFQPVKVDEPTELETTAILEGLKERYESYHNVKISYEALETCTKLATRYITDRKNPDRAIDVLDETCSRIKLEAQKNSEENQILKKLSIAKKNREELIKNKQFDEARLYIEQEDSCVKELSELKAKREKEGSYIPTITKMDVAKVVSEMTGIKMETLSEDEVARLFKMEDALKERVLGQPDALSVVSKALRRWKSGVNDPKRPVGSFLFVGPTGVGKTELAKALAEYMFGNENKLIKIDMSEYTDKFSISKLTGSNPGFVGFEEGSELMNKIRENPYTVVLFDEIEKAHEDVWNIFLQIMDEGILTGGDGKKANFKNSIIIFTSNVGAKEVTNADRAFGFNLSTDEKTKEEDTKKRIESIVSKSIADTFKPEFINRLDKIINFNPLSKEVIMGIVDIQIGKLSKRINRKMTITDSAKEKIYEEGNDPKYGARPIIRYIADKVEDILSDELLKGGIGEKDEIVVDCNDKGEMKLLVTASV